MRYSATSSDCLFFHGGHNSSGPQRRHGRQCADGQSSRTAAVPCYVPSQFRLLERLYGSEPGVAKRSKRPFGAMYSRTSGQGATPAVRAICRQRSLWPHCQNQHQDQGCATASADVHFSGGTGPVSLLSCHLRNWQVFCRRGAERSFPVMFPARLGASAI